MLRRLRDLLFSVLFFGFIAHPVFGTNNATAVIVGTDPFYGRNEQPLITASSVGGGSSSSGGVGNSTSQLGTITGLAQVGYQTGEINLTTGGLSLQEADLVLPGKNGLDLSITRKYSSSRYQSEAWMDPMKGKQWGQYAGRGWAFNIGMRVFVIRSNDSNNIDKIFVESADGIEEYENGVSKQPGNFNRTKVITSGGKMDKIVQVEFRDSNGKIFVFSHKFFHEKYVKNQGSNQYMMEGFYLTKIKNLQGNEISFSYEDFSLGLPYPDPSYSVYGIVFDFYKRQVALQGVIGKSSIEYPKLNGYTQKDVQSDIYSYIEASEYDIGIHNFDMSYTENRPVRQFSYCGINSRVIKITDTYGREILVGYGESSNEATDGKNQIITSLTYADINGNPQKIIYAYDVNASLKSVKIGDLPGKIYRYSSFSPRYRYFEVGEHVGLFRQWHPQYAIAGYKFPDHPPKPEIGAGYPDRIDCQEWYLCQDLQKQYGIVLTEIESALGSKVVYTYEDSLVTVTSDAKVWPETQYGINYLLNKSASTPVVIKKQLIGGTGDVTTYGFNYPRSFEGYTGQTGVGYLKKTKYRPPKQDYDAWYFATAEVIVNPIETTDVFGNRSYAVNAGATVKIEKEQYTFEKAMLTRKTQGISETQTYYDFDRLLPVKTIQYKNGIIQSQSETTAFDSNYNPLTTITKKGASLTPIAKQETSYAKTSKNGSSNDLINKNLLSLPETTTATDLTTNKSRSSFTQYNSNGQPVEAYQGSSGSGKKLKTISYDNVGRVVEEKTLLPNGSELSVQTSYVQNSNQYIITKTLNNKTSVSEYEVRTGQLVKSTDPNGNVTTFQYDRYGRPIGTTAPDGSQSTVAYSSDLKTTTTTSGGITGVQTIDSLGRPILNQATGQQDVKVEYYFANLPKKTYKKQNGVWVLKSTIAYDTYLRKISKTSPDFGTITYTYNDSLNTVTVTDPLGKQSIQKTNELGQTTQTTDPAGGITTYTYNGFGETTQTIDPKGLIHTVETDDYGKPLRGFHTINQNKNQSPAKRSQTTYNTYDPNTIDSVQIFSKTDSTNPFKTYGYQYDSEGRMTAFLLNSQAQETLTYEEFNHSNSKGKLTKAETPDAVTSYDFDNMGRIIKETTTVKQLSKTWDIQYQYNTKGQLISLRYPDGKLVEYVYNSNQQLSQMKYNGQVILTYNYNENGTIASLTYGNGRTVAYSYEKEVLLSNISYNSNQYTQSYSFDMVGKITQTQHNDYINGINPLTRSYTYTNKDELKTVKFNNVLQYTHDFDANSNLTRFETKNNRTLPANNMVVDIDSDQLLRKTHGDGKYIDITYDPEGNMSKKTYMWSSSDMDRTLGYGYNYQGQLQTVSENGQVLAQYGYDHKRQRIYSKTNGVPYPEKYYYWNQNGQVIGEGITGQYGTEYSVRYFYSGNEKIAMERRDILSGDTKLYYFVNNAQGTPVLIVDSENNDAVSRINLDEYGNIGSMIGAKEEIDFTGKKMDLKTGLYYFNQRYYDPELGRFLQEDPAAQGPNLYQYCGNNPLMYTDPDGQWFFTALTTMFGMPWLGGMLDSAAWAGTTSAAINAGAQYALTGSINMGSVWNSFGSGALSGGLSYGVGEIGQALKSMGGEGLFEKTMMHGISGGVQSMAGGGSFGSGFAGGAMGNLAGTLGGTDLASRTAWGALGGGVGAWASGGNFWQGAQAGAYNQLYNFGKHELVELAKKYGISVEQLQKGLSAYGERYLDFIGKYSITLNLEEGSALLALGAVPKSWSLVTGGRPALLGSSNQLTSTARALGVPGGRALGRFVTPLVAPVAVFIGTYNATILVEGLFYALPNR